jgi:hypothetical protein
MIGAARRVGAAIRSRLRRIRAAHEHPRRRHAPARQPHGDRVLVTGWFSWSDQAVTAGDLLTRDVTCRWLRDAGRSYDVANAPDFGEGVNWREVDPGRYSDAIFVCGPVEAGDRRLEYLLQRFGGSRWTGLNVSMLRPLERSNLFDVLIERDSSARTRPDLAFVAHDRAVPVIGVVLVERYGPEYPEHDRQGEARAAITRLLDARAAARIDIDTRLKANETRLRSAAEVESVIAGMDVVVTTRLHGLVLALKHGVPALAIDPVACGAKIAKQAAAVGWPVVRTGDALDHEDLNAALDYCLTDEARDLARACAARADTALDDVRREFVAALGRDGGPA